MNMIYSGGSSMVLRSALNALVLSMCTSSMMYILYLDDWGGKSTSSLMTLMSLTLVLDAPSISITSVLYPCVISRQDTHSPQGCAVGPCSQFRAFASRRAEDVFPTPLGPEKRYAWAILPLSMAFSIVETTNSCPTSFSNACGLFLVAVTSYAISSP